MGNWSLSKPGKPDPLNSRLGYLLKRVSTAAMGDLSLRLQEVDLREVDATVLLLIERTPNIIASRIGRILDIKTANMVPLLRKLEDKGLIRREPIDGKSNGLQLTAAGARKLSETRAILDEFERDLEQRVPEEHRDHIVPALQAIWATPRRSDKKS